MTKKIKAAAPASANGLKNYQPLNSTVTDKSLSRDLFLWMHRNQFLSDYLIQEAIKAHPEWERL